MADAKQSKPEKLTAQGVREMQPSERAKLLDAKQNEIHDAKRSLAARELTNPRKITRLRREIAVIKTVANEPVEEKEQTS